MILFFILTGLCGIYLLISSIRRIKMMKSINRFMEYVDVTCPSLRDDKSKISLMQKLSFKIKEHFRNVYSEENGVNTKGIIITLISVVVLTLGNYFFLGLNIFLVFLIALFFGGYVANLIQIKLLRNEFEKSFPEALVVLSGAISSGNNITQALQDCGDSLEGVMAKEFKTIVKSLNVGDDPTKVFANSYQRLPFMNYYFFLTSLLVSMKSGAKIKEVLSRLSSATTKAKAMEKKKNAITSEVRMSSKITAAIPFAFLILMKFISPDNFDYIMNNPSGRYILYYFLISEGIGMAIVMFLMRKI